VNVLKPHLRITIDTLLTAGASQREIARRTGVDRKTIRRYAQGANSPTPATGAMGRGRQTPPPRPPGADPVGGAGASPRGDSVYESDGQGQMGFSLIARDLPMLGSSRT
jgi:hypothetical protein